jgi:hypothetical protein
MATNIHALNIDPEEEKALRAVQQDLAALRASFLLLTAKLDLDATVTDTNYAALTNPAVQETQA